MDRNALTLIEAEKKLDGVVVNDPSKVIEDFKNTKLYRPAPTDTDYNLIGDVPKVNSELARRYVEMKETVRKQRIIHEAHAKMIQENNAQKQTR